MDATSSILSGPDLALARSSEITRLKWLKDPREIHASDQLHQVLPVNNLADIAWDHTNYRYQWHHNGKPVARPLTRGGLTFNEQSQWWERNGSLWQPEKKSGGGRQTTIDLRNLGVVLQPRISRLLDKAKASLGLGGSLQTTRSSKEEDRGVPTTVLEVSNPGAVAKKTFNLTAKSHILYTQKKPLKLLNLLKRTRCGHPSTCPLHPHVNVDVPQTIDLPVVEEPEKLKATQSAFLLRSCQHIGHEHLSHEQDPCFSDAGGEDRDVQNQENIIKQVSDLAATDTRVEEVDGILQEEEEEEEGEEKERTREEGMLMSLSSPQHKENRPPSASAHTLFHNAAKSLQRQFVTPDRDCGRKLSSYATVVDPLHLRGGSGRRRFSAQPRSWRLREWFMGVRREAVRIVHGDSSEESLGRRTGGRQLHHRVMQAREAGMSDREWANLPVLRADDIADFLDHHERMEAGSTRNSARRGPVRTYHNERGRPHEAEYVATLSGEARRRFEQLANGSRHAPRSRTRSRSHTSESSGSIEVIRDINIQREQLGPPGGPCGRGHPGPLRGGPAADNRRTRRDWSQWDGMAHSPCADVLAGSSGGRGTNRSNPFVIDRELGLRGGFGGRRRHWGASLQGVKAWVHGVLTGCGLSGTRKATASPVPNRLPVISTLTPIIFSV